jgi:hypothetical protein
LTEQPQLGRFNPIHPESGCKADIYLAGLDPLHAWALPCAVRLWPSEIRSALPTPHTDPAADY